MAVIASPLLANGLRSDFADTYKETSRESDPRLGQVMDLSVNATNAQHEFGYFEAAPQIEQWRRGESIPVGGFDSVQFTVPVFDWGKAVEWHENDKNDEQTGTLYEQAQQCGRSAALTPEKFFFDCISNTPSTLPAIPLAPDGAAMFATTAGGFNRFGVTSGNLLTGSGISTIAQIKSDYYRAIEQFALFEDGQGAFLMGPETIKAGVIIIHAVADTEIFETAFVAQRQGQVYGSNTAAAGVSNIILDSSRDVSLWATPRLASGDWYVFLKNPPKKPVFYLDREGLRTFDSLRDSNNSDRARRTKMESVQWEFRAGAGIALPYGAIKIDNA